MAHPMGASAVVLGGAMAVWIGGVALPATAATPAVPTPSALHAVDLDFVLHAAEGGAAEVALGKMAASKATDDNIQQFADQMAKDHSMANKELAGIASAKGTTPSDEPGPAAVAVQEALDALAADGFDTEYMTQQVAAHSLTLALFETCAASCIDPEIKGFAAKHVPIVQDHLKQAQDLLAKANDQAKAE